MIVLNIKRTLAMHRILQITKLCLIRVSWIVSFSDSVLIDDLYMARFVFFWQRERSVWRSPALQLNNAIKETAKCIKETFRAFFFNCRCVILLCD